MPNLGDYLGQILSEITIARMQADIETVRVAELYAAHPLLRNMPVPRFRLPDVDVDVPVVISQMEEPPSGESPRGAPTLADMRKAFDKVVTQELSKEKIRLKPEQKEKLGSVLDKKAVALTRPLELAFDVSLVANELAAAASQTLTETDGPADPAKQSKLEKALKESARLEFLKLRKQPARLRALVTTAEIREAGPGENLARLRMKITEEGFEWTTTESDGRTEDRLVIE